MSKTIKISDEAFKLLTILAEDETFYGPGILGTVDNLLKEWLDREGATGSLHMDPWNKVESL